MVAHTLVNSEINSDTMTDRYYILEDKPSIQSRNNRSFSGGFPLLPASCTLPKCKLCGAQQTFFFQVHIQNTSNWVDRSIAVFQCVDCQDVNHLIPLMLEGALYKHKVTDRFLDSYQSNFRVLSFSNKEQLELRYDLPQRIIYREWQLKKNEANLTKHSFVGGVPEWLVDDESPGTYNENGKFEFLMQVAQGKEFNLIDTAPGQMTIGLDGKSKLSTRRSYRLFLGNEVYFFGTDTAFCDNGIYVITQRN